MKNFKEYDATNSDGEYDFIFETKEEMYRAASELTSHGYMVGGGGEDSTEHRVTINTEPLMYVQEQIVRARALIKNI